MQYQWLNNKNNKNLIVLFNGWGMNDSPVRHLKYGNFDILMFFDYRDISFDFSIFNFLNYEKKYLISWSMGVFTANFHKKIFDNFDKKIAINGTNKIINNEFGIPDKIYKATYNFLNEQTLEKFIKNMFNNGKLNSEITITRKINELKDELIAIQKLELNDEIQYDKVIISNDDKIIPTRNQINFWKEKTDYEIINSTHCPFKNYSNWQDIIC